MPLPTYLRSLVHPLALFALAIGFGTSTASWGGAAEVKLASQPALSPNGDRLVFVWQDDLWIVKGTGGRARRLTFSDSSESQPKFSPDGQQIAFVSNRTGSNQVFVMPVAGGSPEQLTFHTGGFSLEQWLDDGEHLLVKASRDHFWRRPDRLFMLPVKANAKPKLVFDDYATWGRVSKDGKRLVTGLMDLRVPDGLYWFSDAAHNTKNLFLYMTYCTE